MSNSSELSALLKWDEVKLIRMYRHLEQEAQRDLRSAISQSLLTKVPLDQIELPDDWEDEETVEAWLTAGFPDVAYQLVEDGCPDADELEGFARQFEEAKAWRNAGQCWAEATDKSIDDSRCLNALRAAYAFIQAEDWASAAKNLFIAKWEHLQWYWANEEYETLCETIGHLTPGELAEKGQNWKAAGEYYHKDNEWDKALRCFERIEKWDRCLEIAEELNDREMLARYSKLSGNFIVEGECHEEIGNFEDAASCYARDQLWEDALSALGCAWLDYRTNDALALLNITQSWERLANYYRRQENWELAGTHYELNGDLRQAAECFEKAGLWNDAGRCLEEIASASSPQLSLFPAVALQEHFDLLKRASVAYLKADKFELARRCIDRIELNSPGRLDLI
ncbi:Tetratricopeptide repeat protein [compost metagenome]